MTGHGSGVGLVLAGAGARGAYEAGALSVLLPVLEERGERPDIIVGTSAGAINACLVASLAHLPAEQASAELVRRWCSVDRSRVIASLFTTGPQVIRRYLAGLAGVPGPALAALLDNTPLRRTLGDPTWLDFDQVHANIRSGTLAALGVVTTQASDGRTVVFVEVPGRRQLPEADEIRGIRYVRFPLSPDHVLASSAIPVVFPAVPLGPPTEGTHWFFDGGVRLNAPIQPALDLGADRLILVATDRLVRPGGGAVEPSGPPTAVQAAAELMRATLVDRMIEDVRRLVLSNRLVAAAGGPIRDQHHGDGRRYEIVDFVFVGPRDDRVVAAAAARVLRERYSGLRGWLPLPDEFTLLRRALSGSGSGGEDVLSYLLFDKQFMTDLVGMGRRDAREMLARKENPWRATHMPGTPHRRPFDVPSADIRATRHAALTR